MGYLLHILIALGAEGLGELGVTTGWRLAWAPLALLPLPHLIAHRTHRAFLRGDFHRAARLSHVLRWSAPFLHLAAVCLFGWVACVQAWTGRDASLAVWPEPSLILALAPYIVFELVSIDAQARLHDPRSKERRAVRSFQARMFLSALLPIGLYFGLAGVVAANESLRVHVEHVALFNSLFMVVLLSALALALPILMRNTWETAPLPPSPQRSVLERVAERASFRARELLIWRTGNLMANAAIVGVSARSRVVMFSDSLLSILSLRELASVFAHEMGHAVRHHVWIFIAWAMAFFLAADQWTHLLVDAGELWTSLALLGTLGLWALSFGWMSRRFELEADLFSLELLGDLEGLVSALERVGPRERDASGWRHFSTAKRVDFLLRAARDPAWARRFRARLRRITVLGFVAAGVAVFFSVRGLLASYPTDRVWADLALGRYERAAARSSAAATRSAGESGPELEELVRLGARFASETEPPGTSADVRLLEDALARALEAGDLPRASGLAKLAILRGSADAIAVSQVLTALAEGDPAEAREAVDALSLPWRERLVGLVPPSP